MEKNKNDEKTQFNYSTIKNKLFKEYQHLRNKTNPQYYIPESNERINYYRTFDKSSNILNEESHNSFDQNKKKTNAHYNNIKNLKIEHFSKIKKDDYNNTLNKLFFTTSNIIKYKMNQNPKDSIINSYYNINLNDTDSNSKKRLLNKLFPDIDEINKYSNLPFFSLVKNKKPFKMKLNFGFNNKKYKIKQEEFLYKISHNDDYKGQNNINKNKGIKKGTTIQYFHGFDKFCINNKISETNFPLNYKKNKLNLELDIKNITKGGEKTSQMSSKEKRLKMLENNVNNIKSIPNELMNDLEEEVFKILDEEFEKNHSNDNNKTKEEEKEKLEYELKDKKNEKEEKNIINNLNLNFISNNILNSNRSSDNNYINTNTFKRPNKYPINFYTTQQLKKKEHFPKNYKNTFDERIKKLKKEKEEKEKEEKNIIKLKSKLSLENMKDLKEKRKTNNKIFYKKQSKISDILIGNKLKDSYDEVDTKRILNGLKPWIYIKEDERKEINLNILKQKLNEDIKNIL